MLVAFRSEPYTLAMIMDEYFEKKRTGIHRSCYGYIKYSIGKASQDYHNDEIMALNTQWRLNYFNKIDNENYVTP